MSAGRWEHFEHRADIGLRGYGPTVAEAFRQIGLALVAVMLDPATVQRQSQVFLRCSAPDLETLLVDWLNNLIYEMATRHMVFADFEVRIEGTVLQATAWGEELTPERHRPTVEVKAATFHALAVRQLATGEWLAQCVVDV